MHGDRVESGLCAPTVVVTHRGEVVHVKTSVGADPDMTGTATPPEPEPLSVMVNVGAIVNPYPPFVTGIDWTYLPTVAVTVSPVPGGTGGDPAWPTCCQ